MSNPPEKAAMGKLSAELIAEMCEAAIGLDSNRVQESRRWTRKNAEALCDLALSALDRPGWIAVPREPTKDMLKAGYEAAAFPRDPEICRAMYRAMLSALPPALKDG